MLLRYRNHLLFFIQIFIYRVKCAVNKETNEQVAIKVETNYFEYTQKEENNHYFNIPFQILDKAKIQKNNMGVQIKKEITIMKMIRHKNVVAVKDVFATATKIFIVLELVDGGELFNKISKEGKISEDRSRAYMMQIVEGLEYCHSVGVCHRDLSKCFFPLFKK